MKTEDIAILCGAAAAVYYAEKGSLSSGSSASTNGSSAALGKKLWTSGDVWDLESFLTAHPSIASSIAAVVFADYAWKLYYNVFKSFPSSATKQQFDKSVQAHKNVIKYIKSADAPTDWNYEFIDDTDFENVFLSAGAKQDAYDTLNLLVSSGHQSIRDLGNKMLTTMMPSTSLCNSYDWMSGACSDDNDKIVSSYKILMALYTLDLVLSDAVKDSIILSGGTTWDKLPIVALMRTLREELITVAITRFLSFEVRTEEGWMEFDEMYSSTTDISKVPEKTICYVVTDDGPPNSEESDYKTAEFWSQIFATPLGKAMLDAVASLYPVSTRYINDWTDLGSMTKDKIETDDAYIINYMLKYVFSDFIIEIDEKQSMLVKYKRKTVEETYEVKKRKAAAWTKWAEYLVIAAVVAAFAYGAYLTISQAGTAAGNAGMSLGEAATLETIATEATTLSEVIAEAANVNTMVAELAADLTGGGFTGGAGAAAGGGVSAGGILSTVATTLSEIGGAVLSILGLSSAAASPKKTSSGGTTVSDDSLPSWLTPTNIGIAVALGFGLIILSDSSSRRKKKTTASVEA